MRPGEAQSGWESEKLYSTGDEFFADVIAAMAIAQSSVDLESYIFDADVLGNRIVEALAAAARRGVQVRVLVDAIGSPLWRAAYEEALVHAGVRCKVYNENVWGRFLASRGAANQRGVGWLFRRLNQRNHRKIVLIDGRVAWLGSMNVSRVHLRAELGDRAWRDTGVKVAGPGVSILQRSFEYIWADRVERLKLRRGMNRLADSNASCVRLNTTRVLRRTFNLELRRMLQGAQRRVWVRSAYFVPNGPILRALRQAACRGVDVRVLVPSHADVVFMPWVAIALYRHLLRSGVRIFEYQPSMLHAKNLVVDEWMTVGSSNLNHRSLFHDLESDILLYSKGAKSALLAQYEEDFLKSVEVTVNSWGSVRPLRWLFGNVLLLFRYWL